MSTRQAQRDRETRSRRGSPHEGMTSHAQASERGTPDEAKIKERDGSPRGSPKEGKDHDA